MKSKEQVEEFINSDYRDDDRLMVTSSEIVGDGDVVIYRFNSQRYLEGGEQLYCLLGGGIIVVNVISEVSEIVQTEEYLDEVIQRVLHTSKPDENR